MPSVVMSPRGRFRSSAFALLLGFLAARPVTAQTGSPAGAIPVDLLRARRTALARRVGDGVVILRSADERDGDGRDHAQDSDMRQDNDFFYFTDLETPQAWLVMTVRDSALVQTTLYIAERNPEQELWTGVQPDYAQAGAIAGIDSVRNNGRAETEIGALVHAGNSPARRGALYFKRDAATAQNPFLAGLLFGNTPPHVEDLRVPLAAMRQVKDSDEIRRLRSAVDISAQGHLATWAIARPGLTERDLQAEAEAAFHHLGAERLGYPSIIGAGPNSATLHYMTRRATLKDGDLVVMDMGAEFGYYTADLTRTIPANGKFTLRQRAIYQLVLDTQDSSLARIKPGVTVLELNAFSHRYMREHSGNLCGPESCDKYYPTLLSHWLGMDVHDVGFYNAKLEPGMVITVEPGIYLPQEGLGVRIEDDVVITANGYENLSARAPRTIADVERYMATHRKSAK